MAILYLTIGATPLMYSGKSRREDAATADGLAPNAAHRLTGASSSSATPSKFEWCAPVTSDWYAQEAADL
ncbi:hypothetical protein BMJ22_33570 [Sinorhizobium medicae]|nr:hypothetical protein BMJ22_33570 [Sinorhizobium medicae]